MDKDTINQIHRDDLGKVSGIFLIDKPVGITSHDVVDDVRRIFHTKAVGHAGTLDPFASGLLILLVGKFTKKSDEYMGFDKTYEAEIAFGISTDSHDPEGKIEEEVDPMHRYARIDELKDEIEQSIQSFVGDSMQAVPVYSSVKVNGDKLRELARKYDSFDISDDQDTQTISFKNKDGAVVKEVTVSKRKIHLAEIKLLGFEEKDVVIRNDERIYKKLTAKISVSSSKGTYIRQLAYDIGKKFGMPAMLINLRRNRIGEYNIADALSLEELKNLSTK
jgi:tRNA pseudouridine55 synthase